MKNEKELNYKIIDNLVKKNKNVFMFFLYGLETYANRIILVNNKFYIFNNFGLGLVKNKRTIKDLILNCCNSIDKKYIDINKISSYANKY